MKTATEIKKALYKEKPIATRFAIHVDKAFYDCILKDGSQIFFIIPTGEATSFGETEPAQLLIRWLDAGMTMSIND